MLAVYLLISVICAIIGYSMGRDRRIGAGGGLIVGLLLGIIGLVVVGLSPKEDKDWQQNYELDKTISDSYANLKDRANPAEELKKWHDLLVSGAITEDEFKEKKKSILS